MVDHAVTRTLALVPAGMQPFMEGLERAVPEGLKQCSTIEDVIHGTPEDVWAVVLIPSCSLPPEQWWSLWGFLQTIEPRPSVLVYALKSDFEMWTSVLDAGGFDVIVAPFTVEKLHAAIETAAADFYRRQSDTG
jgi:FixJ family two-component response regulator